MQAGRSKQPEVGVVLRMSRRGILYAVACALRCAFSRASCSHCGFTSVFQCITAARIFGPRARCRRLFRCERSSPTPTCHPYGSRFGAGAGGGSRGSSCNQRQAYTVCVFAAGASVSEAEACLEDELAAGVSVTRLNLLIAMMRCPLRCSRMRFA